MAAVNFLYYCSVDDVKDELFDEPYLTQDKHKPFDDRRILRAMSKIYAEINAALKAGGYDVPVTNSVKSTTQDIEKADTINQTVVAVASGDGANFAAGNIVRIHGKSKTFYHDEFTGIIAVSSDNLTLHYLENPYNAGATIELCSQGFLHLRMCNSLGTAARLLYGQVVRSKENESKNKEIDGLLKEYKSCLEQLRQGEITLDGLTTGGSVIATYHTENSTATDVVDRTATISMEF